MRSSRLQRLAPRFVFAFLPLSAQAAGTAAGTSVSSIGNGGESFHLLPESAGVSGDGFAPVLASPPPYLHTDDSDVRGFQPIRACASRSRAHAGTAITVFENLLTFRPFQE
jgi:hypothetical protein